MTPPTTALEHDLDPCAVPPATGALHLLADRARPRPARRGHRRRAPQAPSRPRDRLAGPAPGHRRPRGARRADPPAERVSSPASRRTSPRSRAGHDLNAFQAIRRMDEILVANFMVFHDAVERRRVRPRHRRRGVGRRLLPPREPGAQAHGLRLDDRLRRLAPDARRRRAGGVPDGRLQRRDDRAHRALPAHARPGDLRRRPRRHRARRLRARPAGDPRLDRAALRVLRGT